MSHQANDLDRMLGIELSDPLARRARTLVDNDRRLVEALAARRRTLGLSVEQVAERMDCLPVSVEAIESGARDPRQSTLRRYAMAVEAVIEHRVVDG